MHGNITPIKPEKPAEPVVKQRTITLTNRAPIRIVEEHWPIYAQGACGEDNPSGSPYPEWTIEVRVRFYKGAHKYPLYHTIIHANYSYSSEIDEKYQTVRVGRILTDRESAGDLWKHITEVGDELRERIGDEHMRKYVTYALDSCFANLPPHDAE
jgi:hypothetical protein